MEKAEFEPCMHGFDGVLLSIDKVGNGVGMSWPGFDGHLKWGHDSPDGGATWANDDGSLPSLSDKRWNS